MKDRAETSIEFWYDFASTYSYLTAMSIQDLAEAKGLHVCWRPFLLGPIFTAQGWKSSPFKIYKNKGDYMWRDMERCAALYNLPFKKLLHAFPQSGLLAARAALCLPQGNIRADFTRHIFTAEFAQGKNIADLDTIMEILTAMGQDTVDIIARTDSQVIKDQLYANTAEAKSKKIFGAPSFITADDELFWGHDRLGQALDWCAAKSSTTKNDHAK